MDQSKEGPKKRRNRGEKGRRRPGTSGNDLKKAIRDMIRALRGR